MRRFTEESLNKMFLKTVFFVTIFVIFEVRLTKSNDSGPVSFERLDLQIKKFSKYIFGRVFNFFFAVGGGKEYGNRIETVDCFN